MYPFRRQYKLQWLASIANAVSAPAQGIAAETPPREGRLKAQKIDNESIYGSSGNLDAACCVLAGVGENSPTPLFPAGLCPRSSFMLKLCFLL